MKAVKIDILSGSVYNFKWFPLFGGFDGAIAAIRERYKDKANLKVILGDVHEIDGYNVQRVNVEYDGRLWIYPPDDDANLSGVEERHQSVEQAMFAMVELPII